MKNWINWFEIPATDIERAKGFYGAIFGIDFQTMDMMGSQMALFPAEGGSSGAIVQGPDYVPSSDGPVLYLNGGNDLTAALSKVENAGGNVIVPKTHIGDEMGYFAMLIDTEGNKIALHSMN